MKILIIEDEKTLRDDIISYLTLNNYQCDFTSGVKSGLFRLKENKYSCVLVDLGLPDGSGMDIVEFLKTTSPDTGIIMITAKNALEDRVSGLKMGADDYLTKPFHLSELNARIYSILRRRKFQGKKQINI